MAVQESGWGAMWRKYHALVRVFGGISKGLTLCRTVAWQYSWRRKKSLHFKIWNWKMSSLRRFIGVPPYCSAESAGREAGNVYSRVMKIMFPWKLFIFKHSKIISHFEKSWLLFVYYIFPWVLVHYVSEPRAFGRNGVGSKGKQNYK